ncbi:tautomerase family protein [Streptomyces sp. NPDC059740]|uniref:tautomerase family protein n=1 Tax=Streptomyces sp. NPDC059740 TaxID=3346926 RepID=UPI003652B607
MYTSWPGRGTVLLGRVCCAARARLDALGRAVHEALVETVGIPPDDLFQVLAGHDGVHSTLRYGGYPGIRRDEGIVYVSITLRAGRTPARKQALYRRIAELAERYAGTEPRNVFVALTENASIDWSFGEGLAQYATPEHGRPAPLSGEGGGAGTAG